MTSKGSAKSIDLAMTFSCVGIFQHEEVNAIAKYQCDGPTPGYVVMTESEYLINEAKNRDVPTSTDTSLTAKRLFCFRFNDALIQSVMNHWPLQLVCGEGKPKVITKYKENALFFSEECSSMILSKLTRRFVYDNLGIMEGNAAMSGPVYFGCLQNRGVQRAGIITDINLLRNIFTLAEATINYGIGENIRFHSDTHFRVIHLADGPFAGSVLNIQDTLSEVKFSFDYTRMRGENIYTASNLMGRSEFKQRLYEIFKKKRVRYSHNDALQWAKYTLSFSAYASMKVKSLTRSKGLCTAFFQFFFERMISNFLSSVLKLLEKTLEYAKFGKSQINEIMLGGDAMISPMVWKLVRDFLCRNVLNKTFSPNEAMVYVGTVKASFYVNEESGNRPKADFFLLLEMKGGITTPILEGFPTATDRTQVVTAFLHYRLAVSVFVKPVERTSGLDNRLVMPETPTEIPQVDQGIPRVELNFNMDSFGILSVTLTDMLTSKKKELAIAKYKRHHSTDDSRHTVVRDGVKLTVENNLFGRGDEGQLCRDEGQLCRGDESQLNKGDEGQLGRGDEGQLDRGDEGQLDGGDEGQLGRGD
ncbi:heat shock-related 70 kDa protein 2-like [Rhynchocyon petersi]